MEQNYAETCVKQKTTAKIAFLKLLLAIGVVLLLGIGILSKISILILLYLIRKDENSAYGSRCTGLVLAPVQGGMGICFL